MIADAPVFTPQKWTYDEVSAIEDDLRRELFDGEIFEMPSPTLNHQDIILRLALIFSLWARQHGGKAFISPVDLYVEPRRYFIPDFLFYSAAQMASGEVERDPKRLTIAPALIVEVLSDSTAANDRVRKLHAYAEFGVANYWIVDPAQRILEAFELREGIYSVVAAHEGAEIFAPAAFPELQIALSELFAA
jgi:Uma2 family endonuclease